MRRVVLLMLAAAAALAAEPRTVTLYDVQETDRAPTIDGRLDEPVWRNRPAITPMVLRDAKTRVRAKAQTRTTLLYDATALYVGIQMDEPFPKTLRARDRQYDGPLWWDDSVELYIETGCSHKSYYKFMSTPLGTRADWRGLDTPEGFKLLDWGIGTSWSVAAHVGDDAWSLEFRFPWSDLEVKPPKAGDIWSFEVVRFRYAHDPADRSKGPKHEYSSWNVGASYSAPQRFGNIVFGGSTAAFERLLAERLVPVFGPAIRIYGTGGEVLYTQYPALVAARAGEAAAALAAAERRLAAVAPQVDTKARDALQTRLEELRKRLEQLRKAQATPSAAEDAAKLLGAIEALDWSVKYHELNARLGAAKPPQQQGDPQ